MRWFMQPIQFTQVVQLPVSWHCLMSEEIPGEGWYIVAVGQAHLRLWHNSNSVCASLCKKELEEHSQSSTTWPPMGLLMCVFLTKPSKSDSIWVSWGSRLLSVLTEQNHAHFKWEENRQVCHWCPVFPKGNQVLSPQSSWIRSKHITTFASHRSLFARAHHGWHFLTQMQTWPQGFL